MMVAGAVQSAVDGGKTSDQAQRAEMTKAAQRWVSLTFFGTLLKQMRNSPFKSEVLSGGRGGEVFTSMFDQQLAERMASSSGRRLADSIVRHITKTSRETTREGEAPAEPAALANERALTPTLSRREREMNIRRGE